MNFAVKYIMRGIVIGAIVVVAAQVGLAAQDSLNSAKELYASAAYEDALSTLSRLDAAEGSDAARQVDEYRAFCLSALGRTSEAESVAESIIRKAPLAQLDAGDASPRLESMFAGVRKRLLPSLIRDRYRVARSALDQKNSADAEPYLAEARLMIVEAEKIGIRDEGLGDLSILVDGFLQLIRAWDQQPLPQSATAPSTAAAEPPAVSHRAAAPAAATASGRAVATGARIYSAADESVTPPLTIEQRLPAMTPEMQEITRALRTSGMVDITIDESGRVVDASIRQSLSSSFDALILRTARNWRYRPATRDGVPVRYMKTLVLVP